jgi:L-threonylcarbamoyladenylate synthase
MEHAQAIANLLVDEGGFALLPSDTCYSLAAVPSGLEMSREINTILDRQEEPISLAFDGLPRASVWADISVTAMRLIEFLTPGPLTVVCPLSERVGAQIAADVLAAPDRTLGIRIPDSRIETQLVTTCDSPLTTVAVRRKDDPRTPVTNFSEALHTVFVGLRRIGRVPELAAIEGPVKFATTHSTVVRVRSDSAAYEVLRRGAISDQQLQAAANRVSLWETMERA